MKVFECDFEFTLFHHRRIIDCPRKGNNERALFFQSKTFLVLPLYYPSVFEAVQKRITLNYLSGARSSPQTIGDIESSRIKQNHQLTWSDFACVFARVRSAITPRLFPFDHNPLQDDFTQANLDPFQRRVQCESGSSDDGARLWIVEE